MALNNDLPASAAGQPSHPASGGKAFFVPVPRSQPALRLICFAYAGGAPWTYRDWCSEWPDIEVCTACLPGRGARFHEPAPASLDALIDEFCERIAASYADRPYALFGHSFGALLSFGVAQALQRRCAPPPRRVFVSACGAPDGSRHGTASPPRSDQEWLDILLSNDRVPDVVFKDAALRGRAIATLRTDFHLAAGFKPQIRPLAPPLTAFFGRADSQTPEESMQAWRTFAPERFELHALPGGHFFLHEQRRQLLDLIRLTLMPERPE